MEKLPIFTAALGISAPWYIKHVYFEEIDNCHRLFIEVAHKRRTKFEYDGVSCPVYDHQKRRWRYLNFFQHECYLYGDIPRVQTEDGHVHLVDVPRAMSGSSFTLLFEQLVLAQLGAICLPEVPGLFWVLSGKRVFGIVNRWVGSALCNQGLEPVKHLSVDETSSRRGQAD